MACRASKKPIKCIWFFVDISFSNVLLANIIAIENGAKYCGFEELLGIPRPAFLATAAAWEFEVRKAVDSGMNALVRSKEGIRERSGRAA
jgi:hypothetical protein